MNKLEKEFDEATHDFGGIYIPDVGNGNEDLELIEIKEHIINFISNIKKRTKSSIPSINIQFINNNDINASAFKYKNQYYIGIFKGSIEGMKKIVNDLFNFKKIENIYYLGNNTVENKKDLLFTFMLKFLVAHEYQHINNGHCDLISSLEINRLMEFQTIENSEKALYQQVLEFDADSCAISSVINDTMIKIIPDVSLATEKEMNFAKLHLSYIYLSVYLFFRVFGQDIDTLEDCDLHSLEISTHPNCGIRQTYIASTLSTLLIKELGEKKTDYIIKDVLDCCFEVEKIINNNLKKEKILIAIGITDEAKMHLEKITNLWKNEVRNMLLPYAYDGLAE